MGLAYGFSLWVQPFGLAFGISLWVEGPFLPLVSCTSAFLFLVDQNTKYGLQSYRIDIRTKAKGTRARDAKGGELTLKNQFLNKE